MQTTIGAYDAEKHAVPVTFVGQNSAGEAVTHTRDVNACLTNEVYDEAATALRVADVARGVAIKIELGVITNPPPPSGLDEPLLAK